LQSLAFFLVACPQIHAKFHENFAKELKYCKRNKDSNLHIATAPTIHASGAK
jgi:hypothetical protein